MPENENILIDARNVNVEYETYHALHDIMLSIKAGELVAIIGPNGCGKSTTMRTINGLLKLSTGSLTV
ncbi:MAG: ATP-binding cassette domain-containing protein, partial [Candidatus Methanomethylophilaceae archaeon]|nr:ATP-binding cassette domain-containing protein [Candidatus Methanomethylophilaceae archaeon]